MLKLLRRLQYFVRQRRVEAELREASATIRGGLATIP